MVVEAQAAWTELQKEFTIPRHNALHWQRVNSVLVKAVEEHEPGMLAEEWT